MRSVWDEDLSGGREAGWGSGSTSDIVAMARRVASIWVILLWCAGAEIRAEDSFSQFPGFVEYFQRHPPSPESATAADRELLARFRPRIYLPANHAGLTDFYADYVASSTLFDAGGQPLRGPVSPELLARYARDPKVVLAYRGPTRSARSRTLPPVYARVLRVGLPLSVNPHRRDGGEQFTLLQYHLVFTVSGLPAGLGTIPAWILGAVGDLEDWHQLDHYTAITLVLYPEPGGRWRPLAMSLQQHNYQRTLLFGESVDWPDDGRVPIDVAVRSNELYPHQTGRVVRRAVRFIDDRSMQYLISGTNRPWMSADDVTWGAEEADYRLEFLSGDDPFYLFAGYLGERRLLPGRDGPPGASFNTLPAWKPWDVALFLGYWRDNNRGDLDRWRRVVTEHGERAGAIVFARNQREVFEHNARCALANKGDCRWR